MPAFVNGWIKQPVDHRDVTYSAPPLLRHSPPALTDLRPLLPPPRNQLTIGTCGLNALDMLFRWDMRLQGLPDTETARLYGYWNTRYLMGTVGADSGVVNRQMLKAHANWGFCAETLCPYDVPNYRRRPSDAAYVAGGPNRLVKYAAVPQTEADVLATLAGERLILVGFSVFAGFTTEAVAKSGKVPMPRRGQRPIGGHDVALVGYDRQRGVVFFRNSYGAEWGEGGNGELPLDYILNPKLAGDFWVVESVPGEPPMPAAAPKLGPARYVLIVDENGHELTRHDVRVA